MLTYLVGGAVRDDLLGRPVTDRDWVVVGATPEDMIARGFRQVGADFPVFLHPDSNEEYALARTERKQGHGYHGFVVHAEPDVTLEQDLQRRDLTINAMARDESGYIVDPFNGQTDLHNRQLRHVSPAFAEDPLRILRVARFAARFAPLGFTVAPETLALMAGMARDGEVDHLVPERIWQEMQRALLEAEPVVFFRVLHGCGALDRLIPSLSRMMTREESPLPLRALMAACDLSDSVAVRYGALIAGLNDTRDADALSERLRAPNDCRAIASLLSVTVDDLLGEASTDSSLLLAVFDRCDAWRRPERFADVLTGAEALARARNVPFQRSPIETALQTAKAVDPQMLMAQGHKGKALGEAIRRTRHERIAESLARPGRAAR